MRVLHVIPSVASSDGGPSRAILVMERALTAAGVEVFTATTDHGRATDPRVETVPVGERNVRRLYSRKWTSFYKVAPGLVPWLWHNVRTFDVVHIHALFSFCSTAAGLIARMRGVPYVVRPLGTLTAYGMKRRASLKRASFALLEAPILRRAAAVHFTSDDEQIEARALGIPMREVIIPLGVEMLEPGDPNRLDAEFPALAGKPAILFLSRLDPKKNIEALFDAFASNPRARDTSMLLVAGSGDAGYCERLKSAAQAFGIADRVIWLGHVEGQRKRNVFARADVFVLPSFSENFGIAAVEAMLAGLPCVLAQGVAVATEAAKDGAAISTPPRPDAIAEALDQLLLNPTLRQHMAQNAVVHARRLYSTHAMAEALKSLYANLSASSSKGVA